MRIIYLKCKFLLQSCIPGKSKCLFLLRHHFLTIQQTDTQFYFLTGIITICQINDRPYFRILMTDTILYQTNSRRCIIQRRNTCLISDQQMHIPVNTAIKIKVTHQRHHVQLFSIIHPH